MSRSATIWWNRQKGTWCTELGGKRRTLAKGKQNKKLARERLSALLREQALLESVNGPIAVAALAEKFLEFASENCEPPTYRSYRYSCQKFVDRFGGQLAHEITVGHLDEFSVHLKSTLNDTSRAIVLRSVLRCFNWGVERRLIPPHGWTKIRIPQSNQRLRCLTKDEFRSLLRGTNGKNHHWTGAAFRRMLLALDWTLCRPGELCRLRWEHVHWDRDVAILPDHKTKRTGTPKIIPLVPKFKRLLLWLKERSGSEYCFLNSRGNPWKVAALDRRMARLRVRLGLKDVVPYTVRHTAATNVIVKTGDLKSTSLLMGHASTHMTERYLHLAQSHLVKFAAKAIG